MKKKKSLIYLSIAFGVVLLLVAGGILLKNGIGRAGDPSATNLTPVQEATNISTDVFAKKYDNLVFQDFTPSINQVNELYQLEIQTNLDYENRTFLENFDIMSKVIDDFFLEDFDKSYIEADFHTNTGERVFISYDQIQEKCANLEYDESYIIYLFGDQNYVVQIDEALRNIWFSKRGLGGIDAYSCEMKAFYSYLSGTRQGDDVEINFKDGKVSLSEMETKVLTFLKEKFPISVSENIEFCISNARVLQYRGYEGLAFNVRRVYKGIPFECGENVSGDMFVDSYSTDTGEIMYADSTAPDGMHAFGKVDGVVVEKETITEMYTLEKALDLLSEKIGSNSVYDVHGVELVYREIYKCYPENETPEGLDGVLSPRWKIMTQNQNDDKYTYFYVDVVTGEITQRFEYNYE